MWRRCSRQSWSDGGCNLSRMPMGRHHPRRTTALLTVAQGGHTVLEVLPWRRGYAITSLSRCGVRVWWPRNGARPKM
eukprot:6026210-Lingulodinium_polyedra.AAC.1